MERIYKVNNDNNKTIGYIEKGNNEYYHFVASDKNNQADGFASKDLIMLSKWIEKYNPCIFTQIDRKI